MVMNPSILVAVGQYHHAKLELVRSFLQMEPEDTRVPAPLAPLALAFGSGAVTVEMSLCVDCAGRKLCLEFVEGGVLLRVQGDSEPLRASNLSDLVVFYSEKEFSEWLGRISDGK
jgi:hypothetical protein